MLVSARHKEQLPRSLALSPVRLLGGFICVDTHLGCVGCRFCLNRRDPLLAEILDRGVQLDYAQVGASPAVLDSLVRRLPSFHRARVPLRIGHLTDLRCEEEGVGCFLEQIFTTHPDYPVVLVTRYPVAGRIADLVTRHPSLLVHLSVSPGLDDPAAGREALDSLQGLPARQGYVMLRPLVDSSAPEAFALLERMAPGACFGLHEVSTDSIAGAESLLPMSRQGMAELVEQGRGRGLRFEPYFGCALRRNLGIPFFRYRGLSNEFPEVCAGCANRTVCAAVPLPSEQELVEAALELGHAVRKVGFDAGLVELETDLQAVRGEEAYLSELFGCDVRFSTVRRGEEKHQHFLGEEFLERWQRISFCPVDELRWISVGMERLAGLERATATLEAQSDRKDNA